MTSLVDPEAVRELLRRSDFFRELNEDALEAVALACGDCSFEAGQTVIQQGEEGHCLFIVSSGIVEVVLEGGDESVSLARLGPGQAFGELSLFCSAARAATVRTLEPTVCITLGQAEFEAALAAVPEAAIHICRVLAARMHQMCQHETLRLIRFSESK